jgi:hypothetical protein
MMGTFATADKGIDNTDMIMVDADGRLVIFQVKAMKSVPFYQAIGRVIRMPNDAGKSACGKTAAILSLLKALLAKPRENLGVLKEKKVVKTDALLYYLKRVATWPLYRMQVLLRQALSG